MGKKNYADLLEGCYRASVETSKEYIQKIEYAIKGDMSNSDLWAARGILLNKIGDYDEAIVSLENANKISESIDNYFDMAIAYAGLNNWPALYKCVEKLKEDEKPLEEWIPQCMNDEFGTKMGNLIATVAMLAIPRDLTAYFYRANYNMACGDHEAASVRYRELLDILAKDDVEHRNECFCGLATAHAYLGNYGFALIFFQRISGEGQLGWRVETADALLSVFYARKEYEKALDVIDYAISDDKDCRLLMMKAEMLASLGKIEEAFNIYQLCTEDFRYSAIAFRKMGQLKHLNGMKEEAIVYLRKSMALNDTEAKELLDVIVKTDHISLQTEAKSIKTGEMSAQASHEPGRKSDRKKIKEIIEIDLKGRMNKNETASGTNRRKIQELFQQKYDKQLSNRVLRSYLSTLGYTKNSKYR